MHDRIAGGGFSHTPIYNPPFPPPINHITVYPVDNTSVGSGQSPLGELWGSPTNMTQRGNSRHLENFFKHHKEFNPTWQINFQKKNVRFLQMSQGFYTKDD
jgi:hypothetical protein